MNRDEQPDARAEHLRSLSLDSLVALAEGPDGYSAVEIQHDPMGAFLLMKELARRILASAELKARGMDDPSSHVVQKAQND